MLCSVFNDSSGLYDYFETSKSVPFNADLPVPRMPAEAGKIGVAAVDAGRPLPTDAKYVGSGWTAKGIVAHRGARKAIAGFDEVIFSSTGRFVGDFVVSSLLGVGGYMAAGANQRSKEYKVPVGMLASVLSFMYLRRRG